MSISPELYEAIARIVEEKISGIKVTREDFNKLTSIVTELSNNVSRLEEAVAKLAEAQAKTEERLTRLEEAVERLAEAQKRTEDSLAKLAERVTRLEEAVAKLAEAQAKTEERLTRLEEAVERLAEAQKRTEDSLGALSKAVSGLSDTIGFGLEDIAKVMLPSWLEKHERVRIGELERRFIKVDGEEVEVNLYGEGKKGRYPIVIIGEARARIHGRDVKEFLENFNKVKKVFKKQRVIPLLFGYWIHPSASSLGRELGIRVIASYQR
jgi:predicted  nucleic acid-binding Zn-ribbon protein